MNSKMIFVNNTLKAGIFFVIPIIIVLIIFLKTIGIITPVSHMIETFIDPQNKVPFLSTLISVFLILFIFFMGGILENHFSGSKKIISWIENNVLSLLPAYQLIKGTTQQKIGLETAVNLKVVLVPTDGWVLAFQVEELANNEVLVFIPASPNPYEGNLNIFQKSEIRNTNLLPKDAYTIFKKTGIGTRGIFDKSIIDPQITS
ncbi:MAG: hypothetical protein KKG99_13585 [Bacteroidetes bacterium]|nr:hypothetical protein [Bacteroidota bacterium]